MADTYTLAQALAYVLELHHIHTTTQEIYRSLGREQNSQRDAILDIREMLLSHGVVSHTIPLQDVLRTTAAFSGRTLIATKLDGGIIHIIPEQSSSSSVSYISITTRERSRISIEELHVEGAEGTNVLLVDDSIRSPLTQHEPTAHLHDGSSNHDHHHVSASTLLSKLWTILKHEKRDIAIVLVYSVVMGVLSLVVPLASQSLVTAVSLGVYTTQLVVLCIGVGVGLLLLGVFHIMELRVVDLIRRRIFIRTAFDVAFVLPRLRAESLDGEYAPELVNRFFDVTTITKTISKLLIDGVSAALVAFMGLVLLGIYHPLFLIFDILLVLFLVLIVAILGRGGLRTSINKSRRKYEVAHWLEDISRCLPAFKLHASREFTLRRLDEIAEQYVQAHRSHFIVIARQVAGSFVFRAVGTVGVLGVGGMLVIERQLSLGQLVAAELVIIALMNSLEKLIAQFEDFYDLLTGIDKLSLILDKETERIGPLSGSDFHAPIPIGVHHCSYSYADEHPVLTNVSLHIPAGSRISIIGSNGSGKTTLTELLAGLREPDSGSIEFDGHDMRTLSLSLIRNTVSIFARDNHLFNGTIEDNILLDRECSLSQLEWALNISGLRDELRQTSRGIHTYVLSEGSNLSHSIVRRIILARCIVAKPKLLILDEGLEGVEPAEKALIIERLYAEKEWSIVDTSHDAILLQRAERVVVLHDGTIQEEGTLTELMRSTSSEIHTLFPAAMSINKGQQGQQGQ